MLKRPATRHARTHPPPPPHPGQLTMAPMAAQDAIQKYRTYKHLAAFSLQKLLCNIAETRATDRSVLLCAGPPLCAAEPGEPARSQPALGLPSACMRVDLLLT